MESALKSISIGERIDIVRQRFRKARSQLQKAENTEMQLLQAECGRLGHIWQWHQIVGNGRFCTRCSFIDADADC